MMVTGKRYQVFSIKETIEDKEKKSVWVKAGSAWVNRDGSINVYLDVLPLDGKLHVREPLEERRNTNDNNRNTQTNGSSAQQSNNNEVGVGV